MNDRIIRAIALVLVLLMMLGTAACGNAAQPDAGSETLVEAPAPAEEASEEESSGSLLGGWSRPDSPVITDELAAVFQKGMEGLAGANYIPVAYIGRQIVSGMNHEFLCREKMVVPNAVETYAVIRLYENLEGKVEISDIRDSGVKTWISDLPGGWSQADSPEVTDELRTQLEQSFESMLGADYKPLALLGTQVVAGMNYCVLCEQTVVYPGAESEYVFVYLYVDLDGNPQITDIVRFAEEAAE